MLFNYKIEVFKSITQTVNFYMVIDNIDMLLPVIRIHKFNKFIDHLHLILAVK